MAYAAAAAIATTVLDGRFDTLSARDGARKRRRDALMHTRRERRTLMLLLGRGRAHCTSPTGLAQVTITTTQRDLPSLTKRKVATTVTLTAAHGASLCRFHPATRFRQEHLDAHAGGMP